MKKRGFTIIEALVAIGILTVIIAGAMSAVQSGISSYTSSKDQITAFYLAQEGVEAIRNLRNENRLLNRHWLDGISNSSGDPCYFGSACIVDVVMATSPTRCSSVGNCPLLRQDPSSGFYGYNASWSQTKFKREITLTSINANEVALTVSVTWSKGGISREFKARENLLNWQ